MNLWWCFILGCQLNYFHMTRSHNSVYFNASLDSKFSNLFFLWFSLREMASTTFCKKEILTDILVRLPAKTLVRFMCACKSWSDLINSSSFITTQLNRNVTKHLHVSLLCLHYPDLKRPWTTQILNENWNGHFSPTKHLSIAPS